MVHNALMNGSDQMGRICVSESEAEFSLRVGLGVAHFFHARGEFDQNDLVSRGWFVSSAVGDSALETGGEQGRCTREEQKHYGGE
jgi:hypothetical protein